MKRIRLIVVSYFLFVTACNTAVVAATSTNIPGTATSQATNTPTSSTTAIPAPTLTVTPVPQSMSIAALRAGIYPGSDITVVKELARGSNYHRYYAYYLSEGLKIYALLTI